MLRLVLLIFILLLPSIVIADETEEQLRTFLQSRKVVDQVYFESASKKLSISESKKIDLIVPRLRELTREGYLLRAEGFASKEGDTERSVNLSLARAMSVKNYLKENHKLDFDVFLTGFVAGSSGTHIGEPRRVDIAVYFKPQAAAALFDDQGTIERIVIK